MRLTLHKFCIDYDGKELSGYGSSYQFYEKKYKTVRRLKKYPPKLTGFF